ncbi:YHYH protein [Sphingomonadaceae bacterium]|nr:YHYH protein [Sphingomonadaceae bacterium]
MRKAAWTYRGRKVLVAGLAVLLTASCSEEAKVIPLGEAEVAELADEMTGLFASADIVGEPSVESCTLSGGTQTQCLKITLVSAPTQHKEGPFCPSTIESGPEDGGTWVDDDKVYDVDGPFIRNLSTFYDDPEWQMYDPETGEVRAVREELGCAVAGDPSSAEDNKNTCVECYQAFIETAPTQTYFIPLRPVDLAEINGEVGPRSAMGVAFNGVKFDAPAPMQMILGGHTLGPFDDCGGHVNPHTGYHYHAVLGCEPGISASVADHSDKIGIAMDGYRIFANENAKGEVPSDLDQCGGHDVEELGYHYHAGIPGGNQVLGCFRAEIGCSSDEPDGICDASQVRDRGPPGGRGGPGGNGPPPDGAASDR